MVLGKFGLKLNLFWNRNCYRAIKKIMNNTHNSTVSFNEFYSFYMKYSLICNNYNKN
jgi:hypothetical protein